MGRQPPRVPAPAHGRRGSRTRCRASRTSGEGRAKRPARLRDGAPRGRAMRAASFSPTSTTSCIAARARSPRSDTPAPSGEQWRREIRPDPLLLFRYSAVTFNGHRIHYDHPYVTKVEGYPGSWSTARSSPRCWWTSCAATSRRLELTHLRLPRVAAALRHGRLLRRAGSPTRALARRGCGRATCGRGDDAGRGHVVSAVRIRGPHDKNS